MSDSLVDNDECDVWGFSLLLSFFRVQTVFLADDLVQLSQFLFNDLLSHRVSDSVSVDEDLAGELTLVLLLEGVHCIEEAGVQVLQHDLLELGLDDDVVVVLVERVVDGSAEAYDRLLSGVADGDADHHEPLLEHDLRELHSDRLTTALGVDLLHDVGGNGHVHPFGGAPQEALAHEVEVGEDGLDVVVVTLVVQDADDEGVRRMDLFTLKIGYD